MGQFNEEIIMEQEEHWRVNQLVISYLLVKDVRILFFFFFCLRILKLFSSKISECLSHDAIPDEGIRFVRLMVSLLKKK